MTVTVWSFPSMILVSVRVETERELMSAELRESSLSANHCISHSHRPTFNTRFPTRTGR